MKPYWTAALVLALIGVGIAGYLTSTHLFNAQIACVGGSSCEEVQGSRFGTMMGIPLPFLGLGFYLAVLTLVAVGRTKPVLRDTVLPILLILTLSGAIFSGYLTGVQAAVLGQFCMWCLGSAATETSLLAVTGILLYARSKGVG